MSQLSGMRLLIDNIFTLQIVNNACNQFITMYYILKEQLKCYAVALDMLLSAKIVIEIINLSKY